MFRNCKTLSEAKKLYRQLAIALHPDKGGSVELMALLNDVYEKTKQEFEFSAFEAFSGFRRSEPKPRPPTAKKQERERKKEEARKIEKEKCENLLNEVEKFRKQKYFPSTFFVSLKTFFQDNGFLTEKQMACLESIKKQFSSTDCNEKD